MIRDHNRDYLDFIGFCDIRPSQQERAVKEFSNHKQYGPADVKKLKKYADNEEMLADPDVEMVVIALPLWLHAPVAIEAMKAGKHVFCEKLMAHSIGRVQGDVPGRPRDEQAPGRSATSGTTRSSTTTPTTCVQNGLLGDIRHIRALWHRNNAQPQIAQGQGRQADRTTPRPASPIYVKDEKGNIVYLDSWKPDDPRARTRRSTSPSTATRASTSWSAGGSTTGPAPA